MLRDKARLRRGVDTGHHYSFLGGVITVGPDWKAFLASVFIVAAPSGVFMGFVAPWLGRHLSWALFAISIVLIVFSLGVLFITAFTNPGFLPRNHLEEDEEYGRRNPTKEFQVNGFTVTTKWCTTCNHYRPPRCSHCAVCDNCVDKFDHHCPWVGTCIGRRNYRWFLCFVFSTTLLCMWVFALSLVQLLKYSDDSGRDFGHAIQKYPASMVCMVYTFLAFWFVGGLSAFHIYLSGSNQTTYEHFRHRYSDAGNPYGVGFFRNCASVFCTRVPKRSELVLLASKAPEPMPETEMASRPWEPPPHVEFGDGTGYQPRTGPGGQNGSDDPAHLAHPAALFDEKVPPLANGGIFSPASQGVTPEATPGSGEQAPLVLGGDNGLPHQPPLDAQRSPVQPVEQQQHQQQQLAPAGVPEQPVPQQQQQQPHAEQPAAQQLQQPQHQGHQQHEGARHEQPPSDAVHPAQGGIGVEQPTSADAQPAVPAAEGDEPRQT